MIELQNITKKFGAGDEEVTAVDNISFTVEQGDILCLVGESGCGKSTTGRIVAGLLEATAGKIFFEGRDISMMNAEEYRSFRHAVQIIHQDPYASLNPTQTVRQIISTPLVRHKKTRGRRQTEERALELLEIVDLTPALDFLDKYPHQLSGGQRQRGLCGPSAHGGAALYRG